MPERLASTLVRDVAAAARIASAAAATSGAIERLTIGCSVCAISSRRAAAAITAAGGAAAVTSAPAIAAALAARSSSVSFGS